MLFLWLRLWVFLLLVTGSTSRLLQAADVIFIIQNADPKKDISIYDWSNRSELFKGFSKILRDIKDIKVIEINPKDLSRDMRRLIRENLLDGDRLRALVFAGHGDRNQFKYSSDIGVTPSVLMPEIHKIVRNVSVAPELTLYFQGCLLAANGAGANFYTKLVERIRSSKNLRSSQVRRVGVIAHTFLTTPGSMKHVKNFWDYFAINSGFLAWQVDRPKIQWLTLSLFLIGFMLPVVDMHMKFQVPYGTLFAAFFIYANIRNLMLLSKTVRQSVVDLNSGVVQDVDGLYFLKEAFRKHLKACEFESTLAFY